MRTQALLLPGTRKGLPGEAWRGDSLSSRLWTESGQLLAWAWLELIWGGMGYLCFLQSFWVYSLLFCLCIFKRHSLDCWQLAGFVLGWLVWGFFFLQWKCFLQAIWPLPRACGLFALQCSGFCLARWMAACFLAATLNLHSQEGWEDGREWTAPCAVPEVKSIQVLKCFRHECIGNVTNESCNIFLQQTKKCLFSTSYQSSYYLWSILHIKEKKLH